LVQKLQLRGQNQCVCVAEVEDHWFHWKAGAKSLQSAITCNFAWSLFTCIAVHALRSSETKQVAIVSYYCTVLMALSLHISNLAKAGYAIVGNCNVANIRFLTPESAVGHTVEVVHFVA